MSVPRVMVVEARFYTHIADAMAEGALRELAGAGVDFQRVTVPGVLEIPAAVRFAETLPAERRFDGYVVLGCAIRGKSDHYDHVCREAMRGMQDLALRHGLAVGNGILTVHNEEQALERARPDRKNIGGMAARACLRMIEIRNEFSTASR